ncbi:hypothetical protein DL96DRAFT_1615193 [Flagelloscypha sp. PMI_526]|nr:hypothetical protein DL96DRAFT_1615193 [Flagelloscypha sp. PMI_526]
MASDSGHTFSSESSYLPSDTSTISHDHEQGVGRTVHGFMRAAGNKVEVVIDKVSTWRAEVRVSASDQTSILSLSNESSQRKLHRRWKKIRSRAVGWTKTQTISSSKDNAIETYQSKAATASTGSLATLVPIQTKRQQDSETAEEREHVALTKELFDQKASYLDNYYRASEALGFTA